MLLFFYIFHFYNRINNVNALIPGLPISQYPNMVGANSAAAMATASPLSQNFETTPDISSPLIALSLSEEPPSSKYYAFSSDGKYKFEMRYDLCAGIKEGDWEFINGLENNDFEKLSLRAYILSNFISNTPCDSLSSKLISETTKVVHKIAKQMQYDNSEKITVKLKDEAPSIHHDGILTMRPGYAFSLIGWKTPDDQQMASGMVAHEVAHRILLHAEKTKVLSFKHEGYDVSLKVISEIFQESDPDKAIISKEIKEFLDRLLIRQLSYKPASKKTAEAELTKSNRAQEKEADLLTLRVPYFARGIRNGFHSDFEACKSDKKQDCSGFYKADSLHPSVVTRLKYMTEALCHQYPEENQDICKNSNTEL